MAAFPVFFRLVTGRQLEACGIAMWSCGNNEGALKFAAFLNEHKRDVVFLVDQDSKRNSKHLFNTKKLSEYGLSESQHGIYLGHPNELEDLFEDSVWAQVANVKWKKTDGNEWLESDIASLRREKFSSSLLELFKTGSEQGPKNKQELMVTLALSLNDPSDVPIALAKAFDILISRASP
jgi:putative ATP-dependent endonuclease of OLD family